MMAKVRAFLTNPAVTHTAAALAPVVATLVAAAVAHYPVVGAVLSAVCPK
jgi:hypothetical protein